MVRSFRYGRHGTAAILALVFLVLIATIAISTYWASSVNTRIGYNIRAMDHAVVNAETGIRWITDRFAKMPRPSILQGKVTPQIAQNLWGSPTTPNTITAALAADLRLRGRSSEQQHSYSSDGFQTAEIWLDDAGHDRFEVEIRPDANDARVLHVTSTGYHGRAGGTIGARRSVQMDYLITKFLPYAALGNNQVQIGANTLIEGDIAMRTVLSGGRSPVLCVSDFNHMTSMRDKVDEFRSILSSSSASESGNRVGIRQTDLWDQCVAQDFDDVDGDNFIDEYDIFLKVFDRVVLTTDMGGPTVSKDREFNDDLEWFKIVNLLGKNLDPDKPDRAGFGGGDGNIDSLDRYAKIRGRLLLGEGMASLITRLEDANISLTEAVQGPIAPPNPGDAPIVFGAADQIVALTPENFRDASKRLSDIVLNDLRETGTPNGRSIAKRTITTEMASLGDPRSIDPEEVVKITSANGLAGTKVSEEALKNITVENGVYVKKRLIDSLNQGLSPSNKAVYQTPAANAIIERFPYGATSIQATYKRPVFKGMTFRKCKIPEGLNALFVECKFEDVTFIDTDEHVGGATTEGAGDTWAKGGTLTFKNSAPLVGSGATPAAGEIQTNGSKLGNNIRFESCTFEGPLVGTTPKAYTHFANSWEFNGVSPGTMFDNKWQDPNTGEPSATIIAPQVNIEMGSFGSQSATSELKGVVVGGNVDIRGKCVVDGCLISLRTGSGTMTLGYFGPGDDDNNPSAMPEGGFGSILLRANPLRTLPDGIRLPVLILPAVETYHNLP